MIALLQRVAQASVSVAQHSIGEIGPGLMVLLCAQREDTEAFSDKLLERVLRYRVFSDDAGRMNLSLLDILATEQASTAQQSRQSNLPKAGLLVVPQFTLAADTRSGLRPSFTPAAPPDQGRRLFDYFVSQARQSIPDVQTGEFGADMQVSLVNDGPVTFWLQVPS